MPVIVFYQLKLSISLGVVWLFYRLVLCRLTFFSLNRWYLLGCSLLSFFIPLIDIGPLLREDGFSAGHVVQYIPQIGRGGIIPEAAPVPFWAMSGWNMLLLILALGAMVPGIRLVVRWLSLARVRRKGRLMAAPGTEGYSGRGVRVRIFQVEEPILPFSFGNAIYINGGQHSEKELESIILHEYVHIRQRHTLDILLAELFCIFNWYNPLAWLIRRSIRQNLEFIADQQVLESGRDRKSYQYHLLKVIGESGYGLANNFNFSSLKKRIIMMNKLKSTRVQLVKFLFAAPLVVVLLIAFRDKTAPPTARRTAMMAPMTLTEKAPALVLVADRQKKPVAGLRGGQKMDTIPGRPDTAGPRRLMQVSKPIPVHPLYILNGEPMPEGWVAEIPAGNIQSIDVINGDEAMRLFGARGANGVTAIVTKDAKLPESNIPDRVKELPGALYYIDGKESSVDGIKKLNPGEIRAIRVLKNEEAVKQYGEKGRQGVILIETRPLLIRGHADGDEITVKADTLSLGRP